MSLIDNFTGVNGTTLTSHDANWVLTTASQTDVANWTIQSNELEAAAFRSLYAYRSDSATDTAELIIRGNGTDARYSGPAVRMAAATEGYAAVFSVISGGNYTRLEIRKGGAFFAQLTGLTESQSVDHTLKIVATQNGANVDLEAFIDGTSVWTGTDSTTPLAAGNDGMYVDNRNGVTTIDDFSNGTVSGFTIDTEPTESRANVAGSFTISGPATAPTTGNTSIKLVDGSGPAATIDSVTGSDPYVINYTFPTSTNKLFNSTGYAHYITVDAENATSSVIPYLPETSWDFVTVGTPDTGTDIYTEYAGATWVTGDQVVYDTVSDPSSAAVVVYDDLNVSTLPAPTVSQTVGVYRISAAGVKDVDDTITFTVSGGTSALYSEVVTNIVSNIYEEV